MSWSSPYTQTMSRPGAHGLPATIADWKSSVLDQPSTSGRAGNYTNTQHSIPPSSTLRDRSAIYTSPIHTSTLQARSSGGSTVPQTSSTTLPSSYTVPMSVVAPSPIPSPTQLATDQLNTEYQVLLSRVSLQSAQLTSLQTELNVVEDDTKRKDELLRAAAKGLEAVWQKVQSPIGTTSIPSPPSSSKNQASSFHALHMHSALNALEDGSLKSTHELRELCANIAAEVEERLTSARNEISQAQNQTQASTQHLGEQKKIHAHRLAELMDRCRSKSSQKDALHQWELRTAKEKLSALGKENMQRKADLHYSQLIHRKYLASIFHSWTRRTLRLRNAMILGAHVVRAHRMRALRETYFIWRLKLLQKTRDQSLMVKQKLDAAIRAETMDAPSRTTLCKTVEFLQFSLLAVWMRKMKHNEWLIRHARFRRLFVTWAKLSEQRTRRNQLFARVLDRSFERKKILAFQRWKVAIQSFHTRRLHTLAALCEGIHLRLAQIDHSRKAKGWSKWKDLVRNWKVQEIQRKTDQVKEKVREELVSQQHIHELELEKVRSGSKLELEQTKEDLRAQVKDKEDQIRQECQEKIAQIILASEEKYAELKERLDQERKDREEQLERQRVAHKEQLAKVHSDADKENKRLRAEVDELHLTQKHVVLEMKHQERVHEEWREKGLRRGGGGTPIGGLGGGVHENISGVSGHLGGGGKTDTTVNINHPCCPAHAHLPHGSPIAINCCGPLHPPSNVDPYLNSPVYHHHITKESQTAHKIELDAQREIERKLRDRITSLQSEITKLRSAYAAEHKSLKGMHASQTQAMIAASSSVPQDKLKHVQEVQKLREEGIQKDHALDLAKIEIQQLEAKLHEAKEKIKEQSRAYLELVTQSKEQLSQLQEEHSIAMQLADKKLQEAHETFQSSFAQLQSEHKSQLEQLKQESKDALDKMDQSAQSALAQLRRDQALAAERSESLWQEKLADKMQQDDQALQRAQAEHSAATQRLAESHEAAQAKVAAELEQFKQQARQTLAVSEENLKRATERAQQVEAELVSATQSRSSLERERNELLERNRHLAAALVEHHHHAASSPTGRARAEDHTHVGLNETAILSSGIGAASVMQQAALRPRPSSSFKSLRANDPSSGANGHARLGSNEMVAASSSSADAGVGPPHTQYGLLGFGSIPASSTRLSLTPVTHLAFSQPNTPPLGTLSDEPWPKGPTQQELQTNMDAMAIAAHEDQQQILLDQQYQLAAYESAHAAMNASLQQQHQGPSHQWLRSPTHSAGSPFPTTVASPSGHLPSALLTSPLSTQRTSRPYFAPSSTSSAAAPIAATYRPLTSLTQPSMPYSAGAGMLRSRPIQSSSPTATIPAFTSPRGSSNGSIDVASLFQRGLNQ